MQIILAACRALVVESENWSQRGQFLPDLQTHSPAMGQKDGEKWTAAVNLQPTIPKPDRLLGPSNVRSLCAIDPKSVHVNWKILSCERPN